MIILSIGAIVVVGLILSRVARSGRSGSRGVSGDAGAAPQKTRAQAPSAPADAPARPPAAQPAPPSAAAAVNTPSALDPADPSWAEARRLRRLLLARQVPATLSLWEIVPEEGEVFFYDLEALYERYYGQNATYEKAGTFLLGNPAFILAGLAVTGLANASRRRAAEQQAASQWRDRQRVRVVVSNHRLILFLGGKWLSYHYKAMNAVYPEVTERTLVSGFASIAPLRLSGPDAPILAVMTVFATYGLEGLSEHPSLRALD
ncbi:hypothetical protein GCM10025867_12080 [Frondihabitans sucicola]|uniref:Uncharacterized protein n=1 Tax=Frondihabitans sucicola TaxID=1268041 RepID=A0ABN6XVC0_9MICO|nr:hypothetical protein [Frondihabitans sucicola]BDZ48967.1 hypothetical protein GCM10025867_12080 [Frondihabitans sucicola]